MLAMTDAQKHKLDEFLTYCWGIGAIKLDTEDGFELAHHRTEPGTPRSPTYFNFRTASNPKPGKLQARDIDYMAELLCDQAIKHDLQFDGVCGIPNAGTPLAEALQDCLYRRGFDRPLVTLEKSGLLCRAQGLPHASRVLLADDVISGGESKVSHGVEPLKRGGYSVSGVLVFVDRQRGGAEMLAAYGITLYAALTATQVFIRLREMELISAAQLDTVCAYHSL